MTLKDLRIGNYVNHGINGPVKITGFTKREISINGSKYIKDFLTFNGTTYDNDILLSFVGIPLSEDWLLNAGFYKGICNYTSQIYYKKQIVRKTFKSEMLIRKDIYKFMLLLEGKENRTIDFVHQLQNSYFEWAESELEFEFQKKGHSIECPF